MKHHLVLQNALAGVVRRQLSFFTGFPCIDVDALDSFLFHEFYHYQSLNHVAIVQEVLAQEIVTLPLYEHRAAHQLTDTLLKYIQLLQTDYLERCLYSYPHQTKTYWNYIGHRNNHWVLERGEKPIPQTSVLR